LENEFLENMEKLFSHWLFSSRYWAGGGLQGWYNSAPACARGPSGLLAKSLMALPSWKRVVA
jgi:hypothetical protein